MPDGVVVEWIESKYKNLTEGLDERARRRWAAVEAVSLGWGGIAAVAEATGISDRTIRNGIRELRANDGPPPADRDEPGPAAKPSTRKRPGCWTPWKACWSRPRAAIRSRR